MAKLRVIRKDTGRPAVVSPSDLRFGVETRKGSLAYALTYDRPQKGKVLVPYIRERYGSDWCVRVELPKPERPALRVIQGGGEKERAQ